MARHAIGFTSRGATVFRNLRQDVTGRPLLLLEEGEQSRLELDFQSFLESGETVTGASLSEASNVGAAIANDSDSATLTLSGARSFGEVTVTVSFSSGDSWSDTIRVRNRRRYQVAQNTSDYGQIEA